MKTLQEAEMTRRRWERSISQGSSNEIGEVDKALPSESLQLMMITIDDHYLWHFKDIEASPGSVADELGADDREE